MSDTRRQSYIRGAAILSATMVFSKIVSALYRIPINNILGDAGVSHFAVTYQIYAVLLAVSTSGIPVALSRLISAAASTGRQRQVKRYFSVALGAFSVIGVIFSFIMFFFADKLAVLLTDGQAAIGIRAIAPAVLFVCIVSVYEGYGQGHNDMLPTSVKQITEVLSKVVLGIAVALLLVSQGYGSPVVAAGAIVGTPIGLCIGLFLLMAHKRKADRALTSEAAGSLEVRPDGKRKTLKNILRVSVPITMGAAFMSILTLIDTVVVRGRLHTAAGFPLDTVDKLFGVYAKGQSLLSLPSALVVPVAISMIPVIAAALANHRQSAAKAITETALKLTNVLAMPLGLGMCVLAYPIFNVLYPHSNVNGPAILTIFGIASYFTCLQLMTTAILQANGQERLPMLTFLAGGAVQIVIDYILVGNPNIGIVGSPVGTLACYFLISVLNMAFIMKKVKSPPDFAKVMIKPALCSIVMAVAAKSVYELLYKTVPGTLVTGYWRMFVCLFAAVLVALALYAILVVATKTVSRDDMKLLPRGETLANLLRMR